MTTHKHMAHGVVLVENDVKGFQTPMEEEMKKSVKHFEVELAKLRTGKAHTSLVEDLRVSVYGQNPAPLKTLAALAAPDARLITIQPWDRAIIGDIERAILASDIGINPANDGALIRLQLPLPSTQRRAELVKTLKQRAEDAKVSMRNVRKEFHNLIRDGKADKKISENFHSRLLDVIDKVTKMYTDKIDQMAKHKEQEIMSA